MEGHFAKWKPAGGRCDPQRVLVFRKHAFLKSLEQNNFSEMGLAQLDTYGKYTMGGIVCLHTWVFRVLLPVYFNSNVLVFAKIEMETATYRYSESLTLSDLWGR